MSVILKKDVSVTDTGKTTRFKIFGATVLKKYRGAGGRYLKFCGIPVYAKEQRVINCEEIKRKWFGITLAKKRRAVAGDAGHTESVASCTDAGVKSLVATEYKYESSLAPRFWPKFEDANAPLEKDEVSVIIPCYNGLEHLKKLVPSIFKNTSHPHKFIFINDCSPDPAVLPWLQEQCEGRDDCLLLNNEVNLGFPATVNKGIEAGSGHIVLLNTDTEVPAGWLERLMQPIWENPLVASVTPFSNAATFHSFPFICDDDKNRVFLEEFGLARIDDALRNSRTEAAYYDSPCGVGFCMALNRAVWDEIGGLDAETFKKGYGEECDWNQRAVKMGYMNVIMPRLFVAHHHGGSFEPEKKRALLENAAEQLRMLHPHVYEDTAKFEADNPWRDMRAAAIIRLLQTHSCAQKLYIVDQDNVERAGELIGVDISAGTCAWALQKTSDQDTYALCVYYKKFEFIFNKVSRNILLSKDFRNVSSVILMGENSFDAAWIKKVKACVGI